nr:zinc ribbon domain-containing protein [Paenibacillus monticola]
MIRCGYCGHPLTTTYNKKSYLTADGILRQWSSAKYRCSGKAEHKVKCTGQTLYSPKRIEGVVLDEVYAYLDWLESYNLADEIKDLKKGDIVLEMTALRAAQTEMSR